MAPVIYSTNIVCVLKSGGDFRPEHVDRLYQQVRAHVRGDFEFWCMTDYPEFSFKCPVLVLPLARGWPGWWSKLELFDHFEQAFYLDLDTTIVGDITHMVQPHPGFYALHDLDTRHHAGKLATGVMRWFGDYGFLTRQFALNPDAFMAKHRLASSWGDQGYVQEGMLRARESYRFLQDFYPGWIVSYKLDTPTADTRIICHHGKPRPWEV